MKQRFSDIVEQGRIGLGQFASKAGDRFGAFGVVGPGGIMLGIIAASAEAAREDLGEDAAWDHVSVSQGPGSKRPPDWRQMCWVKKQFWDDDEWVVQFHPAKKDYVNDHDGVLHLWKSAAPFPVPPKVMV